MYTGYCKNRGEGYLTYCGKLRENFLKEMTAVLNLNSDVGYEKRKQDKDNVVKKDRQTAVSGTT